eukprot:UN18653
MLTKRDDVDFSPVKAEMSLSKSLMSGGYLNVYFTLTFCILKRFLTKLTRNFKIE